MRGLLFEFIPLPLRRRLKSWRLRRVAARDLEAAELLAHGAPAAMRRGRMRVRRLGLQWQLDLTDGASRALAYTGALEPALADLLRREVGPGDVVADIGAHVGIHALPLAARLRDLGAGRVLAFEAAPTTAERLRDHVTRNRLGEWVDVEEVALSDAEGELELRSEAWFGADDTSTWSLHGSGEPTTKVVATTFDAWAERAGLERLDVVKMDVEGSEHAVIGGMARTLECLRPRLMVVEEKPYLLERLGLPSHAIAETLHAHGYHRRGSVSDLAEPQHRSSHAADNVVYAHGPPD